jgi:hypothetical protein
MGIFRDIYDVGLDAVEARMPFKISIGIRGEPPSPCVSITNRTRKSALFIQAVRIHHGQKDYSYSFSLEPFEKQQIEAKDTKDFSLSPLIPICISHHQMVKKLPAPDSAAPSFDSPVDLFRAIANGNARDSWIEVDFNEFQGKIFKRGAVKVVFAEILRRGVSKPAEPGHKSPGSRPESGPEFQGKIGHKCSKCGFVFLVPNPDLAALERGLIPVVTCPNSRCRQVDRL